MAYQRSAPRPIRPLDLEGLQSIALHYAGRYATTGYKLRRYLERKLRERGWAGDAPADLDVLIERFASLGYVDDAGFATNRAASLVRKGFGANRIRATLRAAGIDQECAAANAALEPNIALAAALSFAKRRRLGPFANDPDEPKARQRGYAALMRAGHDHETVRRVFNHGGDAKGP